MHFCPDSRSDHTNMAAAQRIYLPGGRRRSQCCLDMGRRRLIAELVRPAAHSGLTGAGAGAAAAAGRRGLSGFWPTPADGFVAGGTPGFTGLILVPHDFVAALYISPCGHCSLGSLAAGVGSFGGFLIVSVAGFVTGASGIADLVLIPLGRPEGGFSHFFVSRLATSPGGHLSCAIAAPQNKPLPPS